MKTIYVSDKTSMTLESMKNISQSHILYKTFYKKEVDVKFRCNVCDNAQVKDDMTIANNTNIGVCYMNFKKGNNILVYSDERE